MPAYITQANTGSDTLTASRTITKPGTVSAGDVGVFWLVRWNEAADFPAVTPPAGAVLRGTLATGDAQTLCYILEISSESSFVFSWTGSRWCTVSALFFSGVDPDLDFSTTPFQQTSGSGTAISTLTVNTVNTAALVWHVNTINGGADTHTPPVNFPETWDVTAGSTAYRISPGDGDQSAAGATNSGSVDWIAGLVALAPAATGGGDASVSDTEIGTGNETQSVSASNANSEAASGVEGTPKISVRDSDTSTSLDNQLVTQGTSGSDTTGGSETEALSVQLSDSDTGVGSDNQTISASSSDSDISSSTETESAGQGTMSSEDSSGSETETLVADVLSTDLGAGVESQLIDSTSPEDDTLAGSETYELVAQISDSDLSNVTDSATASVASTTNPASSDTPGISESWHIAKAHAPVPEHSLVMGPATLYIATYGAVEPSNGSVAQVPDSGVWTDLGGLLGGVDLSVDQEWEEIRPRQVGSTVTRRLKRRRLTIKTQLAEATLSNLAYALNDLTGLGSGSGWTSYTPTEQHEGTVLDYMALIVDGWAPGSNAGGQHKRRRLIVRKCLSVDNVQMSYKKDGQTVYTVSWTCHYVDSSTPIFRAIDEA